MMTLISHIEYLIKEHECVIIPGFGALISYYTPSYVSERGELIPPKLLYGFNAAIKHNDGLLANSIMRKNGVSYDEAVDIIDSDVRIIKSQLANNNEFIFGEIGIFVSNENGQIVFEPNERVSYSKSEMFGLQNIKLSVLDATSSVEVSEKKDVVYISLRKDFFRIAASIIVLVVMAFMLSTPIALDDTPDYAGFKFTTEKNTDSVVVETAKIPTENKLSEDSLNDAKSLAVDNAVVTKKSSDEVVNDIEYHKYYLIVATFRTKKQAELYIKQSHDNSSLKVLDNGSSLYRVYVAADNSYGDLSKKLSDIYDTNPDAWIYRNVRKS